MAESKKREQKFTISVDNFSVAKFGMEYVKEQVIPKLYDQASSYFKYGWNLLSLNTDYDDKKHIYLFSILCQSKVNEEEEGE